MVGAHIGTLAVKLANNYDVTAIEANPTSYSLLTKNVKLNKLMGKINCFNVCASDSSSRLPFIQNTVNSGGSKIQPSKSLFKYFYDNPRKILVESKKLDDFLHENIFDTVIMDIEGGEYNALKGMPSILKDIDRLFIEFVPHHIRFVSNVTFDEWWDLVSKNFDFVEVPDMMHATSTLSAKKIFKEKFDRNEVVDLVLFYRLRV